MERIHRLPRTVLLCAAALVVCVTAPRTACEEPSGVVSFSAQIAADNTPISSAPGTGNYYETGTLRAGDIVEIFYKNEDGWCAIRPPEGSYSWVNGQFVRPAADGTGTIISPDPEKEVPVRVGADSVLKSTGVQVGLKSGRTVTIFGETTLTGGTRWYRIAPPPGEFRWIHLDALLPNELLARIPNHLVRQSDFQDASNGSDIAANGGDIAANGSDISDIAANSQGAQIAEPEVEELPMSILHPIRSNPGVTDSSAVDPVSGLTDLVSGSAGGADSFHLEMAKLQRDLFSIVENSGSPEAYELLIERAATLFSAAIDDTQRTEAQRLYQKIKSFRDGKVPSTFYNPAKARPQLAEMTLYAHPLYQDQVPYQNRVPYRNRADSSVPARQKVPVARSEEEIRTEEQRLAFVAPAESVKGNERGKGDRVKNDRSETQLSDAKQSAAKQSETKHSEMKFAFADGNGPFSMFGRGKRGHTPIVPPANYRQSQMAPEMSIADTRSMAGGIPMIGAMINQSAVGKSDGLKDSGGDGKNDTNAVMMASLPEARPAQPAVSQAPGSAAPAMLPIDEKPAGGPAVGPTTEPLSEPAPSEPVPSEPTSSELLFPEPVLSTARPVSFEAPAADSDGWVAPGTIKNREPSAPKPLNEEKTAPTPSASDQERFDDGRFDVVGVLGYFPDRPSGYPPYAIVRSDGRALEILSYITPEKGKNLDSFVGKKVGVNGTQGWFKRGDDNRRLITARAVFPLE